MTISHSKFAILAVPGQYVALLDMLESRSSWLLTSKYRYVLMEVLLLIVLHRTVREYICLDLVDRAVI